MTEAAPMPMARTAQRGREKAEAPGEITFPELVWAHHLREQELHKRNGDPYAGPAEERYRAFRSQFQAVHGWIVDEYWCTNEASAAVVAMKPAVRPLRWVGAEPSARIYRATDWQTRDLPVPVAELVHECEALAMRAREVLRSTAQRLVIQRLFGVTAYLLGTFDGNTLSEEAAKPVLESAQAEVAEIRAEYVTAATRSAQIVYFWGMLIGLGWLALLGFFMVPLVAQLDLAGPGDLGGFYGCAAAGALGAIVSVIARMNSSSFAVDYDVGRPPLRRLGAFRPLVGSVFGIVIYFALVSGLMQVEGDRHFPFYAVFAFIAGFSERFVRDTLDGVAASAGVGPKTGSDTPPPAP